MTRILNHIRDNIVAYIALFVALGGTSYAAWSLPAGSVGTRQLRNGAVTSNKIANASITPAKLAGSAIGGSIRHWASISVDAKAIAGSRGVSVSGGNGGVYRVSWGDRFSSRCAVLTSSPGVVGHVPIADSIGTQMIQPAGQHGVTVVWVFPYSGGGSINAPFYVAVLC